MIVKTRTQLRDRISAFVVVVCSVVGLNHWLPAQAEGSTSLNDLAFTRLESPEPPHRSIFALLEDRDGFLWIGTQDGLARYDGYEMRVLRHDPSDRNTLSNSSVRMLLEDRTGTIWVGTENGLNVVDARRLTVARVPTPGHPDGLGAWFHCAFEDRDGGLWFGCNDGLLRLDPGAAAIRSIADHRTIAGRLTGPAVVGIQQDQAGSVWVAASRVGGCTLFRLSSTEQFEAWLSVEGAATNRSAFLVDSRDRFWIHPSGPVSLPLSPGARRAMAGEYPCRDTRAALEAADGSVWISCDDGLYHVDPEGGEVEHHRVEQQPGSWLENFGMALCQDRSGTLWVGTEGGLYRHDPHAKPFVNLRRNPAVTDSLSASAISAVAEASAGELWVATYGGGLNRVDRAAGRAHHLCVDAARPEHCTGDVLWHLHAAADGALWIAGDELWRIDSGSDRLVLVSDRGVSGRQFLFVDEGEDGSVWVGGTEGGLYRYPAAGGELEEIHLALEDRNPETRSRIDSLLVEPETVWLGLSGRLGAFDRKHGTLEEVPLTTANGASLTGLGTWAIHRDSRGILWLGTSVGLVHRRDDGSFEVMTTHDGLPGSAVYSILEDAAGALWLGTSHGLTRFDPMAPVGERIRPFTPADGVGNVEFNRHAAVACADGVMVFGGMDGLTFFQPEAIRPNPVPPRVRITGIDIASRAGVRRVEPGGLEELELGPGDTTVSFTFAALSFTAPALNGYRYVLEGFDADWTEAGTRRATQYTRLPPGSYGLRVQGANNDGVWDDEGASLAIRVRPAPWQAWWFKLSTVALLVATLWAGQCYREAKKRELNRLRIRIAGDLHDDLSSDLSGIAVLADMMDRSGHLDDSERGDLRTIRDASLRMADGLRDIVWYIDPDHDSLPAMVRRMRAVTSTMLRGLDHDFRAVLPERCPPLPVDTRRNVFLIFKEALNNILRHASARRVDVEVTVVGSRLEVAVRDDGRGFDLATETDGHGLTSMRRRAAELGAGLDLATAPGAGTRLRLTVNLAGSRDGGGTRSRPMLKGERSDTKQQGG